MDISEGFVAEINNLTNGRSDRSVEAVAARRRSTIPLLIVVALFIGVSFYTWHTTWFGRQLNDQEIEISERTQQTESRSACPQCA